MIEIADETGSVYFVAVKTLTLFAIASLFLLSVTSSFAGTPAGQTSKREEKISERLVFVTGSLIPQRIQVRRIGTTTGSPLDVIGRRDIDQTGRQTTPGAFINDPSVRIIGH